MCSYSFLYTQSLTNLTRCFYWPCSWNDCNVYFVMLIFIGGGWTLVVTISSKSNDHLQDAEVHCFKPTLCVPFVEKNSDITARKSGDEDIPERMHLEDQSENVLIRVLLSTLCIRSAFYFCFCCKFKGRRLKVSMLTENLEVFGLHRFHYIWFFTFNLESKFLFSGTFRVDVLTRNVTYTVFLPGIAHYMFEFNCCFLLNRIIE